MKKLFSLAISLLLVAGTNCFYPQNSHAQYTDSQNMSPEYCLNYLRTVIYPKMPQYIEATKAQLRALVPDPMGTLRAYPNIYTTIQNKDVVSFNSLGGLSEHLLFSGHRKEAMAILTPFIQNAEYVSGEKHTGCAQTLANWGYYLTFLGEYEEAESYLIPSTRKLEKYYSHSLKNNLSTNYFCLTMIKDKAGNTNEAAIYAKKYAELADGRRGPALMNGITELPTIKAAPAPSSKAVEEFDVEAEAEKVVAEAEAKERAKAQSQAAQAQTQTPAKTAQTQPQTQAKTNTTSSKPQTKPPVVTQNTETTSEQSQSTSNQSQNTSKSNLPVQDKWALVIGISQFEKSGINLKYAAKDAKDFYDYLVKEGGFRRDHVSLLLNKDATRKNIMSAFGDSFLPSVCEKGDMVVIFISTHGTPANKDTGASKRNYIVAYDTEPSKLYSTGVDMDQMYDRLKECGVVERTLLVMDTCYSGAGIPGKGLGEEANFDANSIAQGSGTLVMTSSSNDEKSYESTNCENGVFTKHLLKALRKAGRTTDVQKAFEDVKEGVRWEVKSTLNKSQIPQLGGEWEGADLILAAPAAKPRESFNAPFTSDTTVVSPKPGALKPGVHRY